MRSIRGRSGGRSSLYFLEDAVLPDGLHDLLLRAFPTPEVRDPEGILDAAESRVGFIEGLGHAAETILDKYALRIVGPEKSEERVHQAAVPARDVAVYAHESVLGKDRPARVHDVRLQPPPRPVPQGFLLVGDERVAEAVLELGARGTRGSGLRHDVLPDPEEEIVACPRRVRAAPRPGAVLRNDRPVRSSGSQRVRMNDAHAGRREIPEIPDAFWLAGAHQDDERCAVHDAAKREPAPALRRDHPCLGELVRVELERQQGQLRRNAENDLVRHGPRSGEGGAELDPLARALPPLALELREDAVVDDVAEDAEPVEHDRARNAGPARHRYPRPHRVDEKARARSQQRGSAQAAFQYRMFDKHRPPFIARSLAVPPGRRVRAGWQSARIEACPASAGPEEFRSRQARLGAECVFERRSLAEVAHQARDGARAARLHEVLDQAASQGGGG